MHVQVATAMITAGAHSTGLTACAVLTMVFTCRLWRLSRGRHRQ